MTRLPGTAPPGSAAAPTPARLRIGLQGAGSIGCYVAGKLLAADTADVVLVGRPRQAAALARGLTVQDFDGAPVAVPGARVGFATEVAALAACDVVLCCVKSQHTDAAARELAGVLAPDAVVVSLQNGVRNPDLLRVHLTTQQVIPSIVTWNVIAVDGTYRRATSGPLMLAAIDAPRPRAGRTRLPEPSRAGSLREPLPALVAALTAAKIPVEQHRDLAPHQWTKLVVNLANAVSALTDVSTGQLLLEPGYRRVIAALADEGLAVLRAAKLEPARFQGVPLALMPKILRLPTPLVRVIMRAQLKVDPAARSSMWQDLAAGRPTEVEYLNGEIVRVAAQHGTDAPRNRRIVALVHDAERAGGSPKLSPAALWAALSDAAP